MKLSMNTCWICRFRGHTVRTQVHEAKKETTTCASDRVNGTKVHEANKKQPHAHQIEQTEIGRNGNRKKINEMIVRHTGCVQSEII